MGVQSFLCVKCNKYSVVIFFTTIRSHLTTWPREEETYLRPKKIFFGGLPLIAHTSKNQRNADNHDDTESLMLRENTKKKGGYIP